MSATHTNIDRFNLAAIELFSVLYDHFPLPTDIETTEIGVEAAPEETTPVEMFRYTVYAEHALTWLVEEGFLRYEPPNFGTCYRNVRLTLKGLTLLGYVPSSLKTGEHGEPIIAKIKRVLSGGTEKAATETVKSLLSELFKLAMTSGVSQAASAIVNV